MFGIIAAYDDRKLMRFLMINLSKGDRVIFVNDWGDDNWSNFANKGVIVDSPDFWGGKFIVSVNGKKNTHGIPTDFLEKI